MTGYGTITKLNNTAAGLGTVVTQPTLDLLTAMGHGNGSGSTEEFQNVPGFPNLLRAKNFGATTDSDEAKINLAIAAAAIVGADVLVDKSMIPYGVSTTAADDSHVLHDPDVHMFREGGSLRRNDYEPEAYGATPIVGAIAQTTTGADSWAAITACAAGARANQGTVRGGSGMFYLSRPWVETGDLRLVGQQSRGAFTTMSFALKCIAGPALVLNYNNAFGPTGSPLVSGSTCSFGNGSSTAPAGLGVDLRDSRGGELNGLAAFCYEQFFTTANTTSTYFVAASGGSDFSLTGHSAFRILTLAGGALQASLTVGGVVKTISGGTINAGTTYWFALTYDGSTIRLFYGEPGGTSTLAASTAATGTITQDSRETVVPLGDDPAFAVNSIPGYRGPCRISKVAIYTTTGTVPNTTFGDSSDTLVVVNLDLQDGVLTRGRSVNLSGLSVSGITDWWFWCRTAVAFGSRHYLEDVGFLGPGSGLLVVSGQGSVYRDLSFSGCRDSFVSWGSNWASTLDNPYINQSVRYGIRIQGEALYTIIEPNLANACGRFGLSVERYARVFGGYMVTGTTSGGSTVAIVDIASGGTIEFHGTGISFENAATGVEAVIHNAGILKTFGGTIETQLSVPFLWVNGGSEVHCHGTTFGKISDSLTSVMKTNAAMTRPAYFEDCQQSVWVPWSDRVGTVTIGPIGKVGAVTYSATPTFACDVRDEFEITLTGDCAPTITNVTPGQSILVTIIQDGSGAHGFTWPANVKGGGTVSATGGSVNQQRFTAMLDSATNPTLMADAAMVSV